MTRDDKRGVVYIATGSQFVKEAKISADSVNTVMPDVSMTLFTDQETDAKIFDNIIPISDPRHDFGDQVYYLDRTPYERTIFLDTDIYLDESIEDVFDVLDEFDIAASQDTRNYSSTRTDFEGVEKIPDCFSEYNSGVVAFRKNSDTRDFFEIWKEAYEEVVDRGQVHNQAAFRYALYHSDTRIATLPREYNCLVRNANQVYGKVKAFHGRLIDISTPGAEMTVDVRKAANKINSRTDHRLYHTIGGGVKLVDPSMFEKLQASITNRGIMKTLFRAPEFVWRRILTHSDSIQNE
jgi:hypothetical protein